MRLKFGQFANIQMTVISLAIIGFSIFQERTNHFYGNTEHFLKIIAKFWNFLFCYFSLLAIKILLEFVYITIKLLFNWFWIGQYANEPQFFVQSAFILYLLKKMGFVRFVIYKNILKYYS